MANGKVDWDSQATWQRVIAAILATGVKVDLKQTALYFGTTYDTLENRFRKIKKESATLKDEVERGERGEVAPTRTKSNPATPRKHATPKKAALSAVTNGRVTKTTPSRSGHKNGIKREMSDDGFASALDSFTTVDDMSFMSDAHSGLIGYDGVSDDAFAYNDLV